MSATLETIDHEMLPASKTHCPVFFSIDEQVSLATCFESIVFICVQEGYKGLRGTPVEPCLAFFVFLQEVSLPVEKILSDDKKWLQQLAKQVSLTLPDGTEFGQGTDDRTMDYYLAEAGRLLERDPTRWVESSKRESVVEDREKKER